MLKAAIFDLDGTLYDYDAAHASAFRALTEYAGTALSLSKQQAASKYETTAVAVIAFKILFFHRLRLLIFPSLRHLYAL